MHRFAVSSVLCGCLAALTAAGVPVQATALFHATRSGVAFVGADWQPALHDKAIAGAATPGISGDQRCSSYPYGATIIPGTQWASALALDSTVAADGASLDVKSNWDGRSCVRGQDPSDTWDQWGLDYQCTQLAVRAADVEWGEGSAASWTKAGWNGNAYNMYDVASSLTFPLVPVPNGGGTLPEPGDLLVWNHTPGDPTGHVAVVERLDTTNQVVWFVSQNSYWAEYGVSYSGTTLDPGNQFGLPLRGWIDSPLASPPDDIVVNSAAAGQATVSWSPAADSGSKSVTGYSVTTFDKNRHAIDTEAAVSSPVTITGLTNGTPYYFGVASANAAGTGRNAYSYSVTPSAATPPPLRMSAVSAQQYVLPNSDGASWQRLDEANLSLAITPASDETVSLSANADLWTWNGGYNTDLGIEVTQQGEPPVLVAWKESGGSQGTFSPDAAFVETVLPMRAGTTYAVEMVWKTNRPALGASVSAGAGPFNGMYSPTSLLVKVLPPGAHHSVASSEQYVLQGSDGTTWHPVDRTQLSLTLAPATDEDVVLSANADLWTWATGYNQDLGLQVTAGNRTPVVVAWKEGGGFGGAFSPRAAYVQTVQHLTAGTAYTVQLVWKANRSGTSSRISIGAGPIDGAFSPTRLTAWTLSNGSTWGTAMSASQYRLAKNGGWWNEMDAAGLAVTLTPSVSERVLVGSNADLWTSLEGYNQDIGVFVSDDGGPQTLLGWKESGGSGGAFSPNAAFVETNFALLAGHTYVFSVWWKANRPAPGGAICVGAGPIGSQFSPTTLSILPD